MATKWSNGRLESPAVTARRRITRRHLKLIDRIMRRLERIGRRKITTGETS